MADLLGFPPNRQSQSPQPTSMLWRCWRKVYSKDQWSTWSSKTCWCPPSASQPRQLIFWIFEFVHRLSGLSYFSADLLLLLFKFSHPLFWHRFFCKFFSSHQGPETMPDYSDYAPCLRGTLNTKGLQAYVRRVQSPLGPIFLRSHLPMSSLCYTWGSATRSLPRLHKHQKQKKMSRSFWHSKPIGTHNDNFGRNGQCTGQSQRITHRSPCTCPSNLSLKWWRVLFRERAATPPSLPLAFCVSLCFGT